MLKVLKKIILAIILLVITLNGYQFTRIIIEHEKRKDKRNISKVELLNFIEESRKNNSSPIILKTKFSNFQITELDLSGQDLSNIDFTGFYLSDIKFNNSNLQNSIFSTSSYQLNFTDANLDSAKFIGGKLNNDRLPECMRCVFENANLKNADLSHGNFNYLNMKGANFSNTNLSNSDLTTSRLQNAKFINSNIKNTKFHWSKLEGANFEKNNVKNVMFMLSDIPDDERIKLQMMGGITSGKDLENAVKSGQDLSGFDFGGKYGGGIYSGLNLQNGNFANSNSGLEPQFIGTNLKNANLEKTIQNSPDYTNADLSYANLRGTRITGATSRFVNTNLKGADLTEAYISGDFTGANFEGAILNKTTFGFRSNLTNSDFSNANVMDITIHKEVVGIDKVKGLSQENIEKLYKSQEREKLKNIARNMYRSLILLIIMPSIIFACGYSGDCL